MITQSVGLLTYTRMHQYTYYLQSVYTPKMNTWHFNKSISKFKTDIFKQLFENTNCFFGGYFCASSEFYYTMLSLHIYNHVQG